ncbi:MAG: hypothetical protein H6Q15_994 [Bacteroidetes bacterium]|nr:hypothetical protein [Bacteroidota bacterium]
MKTYRVEVEKVTRKIVEVKATSAEDAILKLEKQCQKKPDIFKKDDEAEYDFNITSNFIPTPKLIKLLKATSPEMLEAKVRSKTNKGTRFFEYISKKIVEKNEKGETTIWELGDFRKEYSHTTWGIGYVVKDKED